MKPTAPVRILCKHEWVYLTKKQDPNWTHKCKHCGTKKRPTPGYGGGHMTYSRPKKPVKNPPVSDII